MIVLRFLLLTEALRTRAGEIRDFAHANPYQYPFRIDTRLAAENHTLRIQSRTVRGAEWVTAIFLIHIDDNTQFRNLTISTQYGDVPHAAIIEEIARLFGFDGDPSDWDYGVIEPCIYVTQPVAAA